MPFDSNPGADSATDTPSWQGLNKLGKQVIKKMEDLRMVIDLSQCSIKELGSWIVI